MLPEAYSLVAGRLVAGRLVARPLAMVRWSSAVPGCIGSAVQGIPT